MTLPLINNADGGTNGATVTTGNSGGVSGDAWNQVAITSGTLIFDSTQKMYGSLSYKYDPAAGGISQFGWDTTSIGIVTEIWGRTYHRLSGISVNQPAVFFGAGGGASAASIYFTAGNHVKVWNAGQAAGTEGSVAVSASSWFRLEYYLKAHASAGTIEAKLFLTPDSTTVSETITLANTGTNGVLDQVMWGGFDGTDNPIAWVDSHELSRVGYVGPTLFSRVNDQSNTTLITSGTP